MDRRDRDYRRGAAGGASRLGRLGLFCLFSFFGLFSLRADLAVEVVAGGIARANCAVMLYDPGNRVPEVTEETAAYVIRSVPEGRLFPTTTNYVASGSVVRSPTLSPTTSAFAYWTVGGTRVTNMWGRAAGSVTIAPDATGVLDVVAYAYDDYATRQSWYWYGRADVSQDIDTDGDGLTFAQELAAGTNPLFADSFVLGGIAREDGDIHEVGPKSSGRTAVSSAGVGEIACATEALDTTTKSQIRSYAAQAIAKLDTSDGERAALKTAFGSGNEIAVSGPDGGASASLVADMGIAPALAVDETGTLAMTYATPTLEITSFDPTTGKVGIKVTPGEGNQIVANIDTGCVSVYGTDDLGKAMTLVEQVDIDLTPYLDEETKGEGTLTVTPGAHTFLKIRVESSKKEE